VGPFGGPAHSDARRRQAGDEPKASGNIVTYFVPSAGDEKNTSSR